jgi:2,4-dienoyl-CoA reductase-like NADH-dependent reductase (Old Yellow Enzyme family)/thioredoxin reductase
MSNFKHLFSPMKVGSLDIPNRLCMSPHAMIGLPIGSEAQAGYFEARAKGGAGFMGIASCQVQPSARIPPGLFMRAYSRDEIPAINKIVMGVHKWGAKIFVQGVWMMADTDQAQASGSAPHTVLSDSQPRSMTIDEIHELIEAHVISAANAQEAGADGFEFPIGGGAGLQSFASSLYNQRVDRYGGSLEGRMRAIVEILHGIRSRCGPDFALGVAVNADDSTLGGDGLEEGVEICKLLAATGQVDWLRITARGQKPQMTHYHYPSSYMPHGTHLYAAAAVRKQVKGIPIVSGGRVLTAQFADQLLDEGQCDMVFVARAMLADPAWANKSREGKTEEIRACIGDLEGCFLRSCVGHPVGCTVNPEVGHEHEPPFAPATKLKKVLIAGGGVAGMQAAMVAAQRGHKITLLEKSGALGGHVTLQAKLPGLEDRQDIVRWLTLQLKKHNVDVRLNTLATPEKIAELAPDAIVIATGAAYSRTGVSRNQLAPIPGTEAAHVLTPEDVVLRRATVGQRVVVYDNTAYEVGPGVAELLADQGKEVVFISIDSGIAMSVTEIGINKVVSSRLLPKAQFIASTRITRIDDHTVKLKHVYTGETTELKGIDTVVLVTSKPPEEALYHALVKQVPELHLIGDARESRWSVFATDEAIKDGRRVGLLL